MRSCGTRSATVAEIAVPKELTVKVNRVSSTTNTAKVGGKRHEDQDRPAGDYSSENPRSTAAPP